MAGGLLNVLLTPSVHKRIVGGFAVELVLLVALAAITFRLMVPVDAGASRVRVDSDAAGAAASVSLQVSDAHARVAQYALTAAMGDQKAARDSLAQLDRAISGSGVSGAGGGDGLATLAGRYRSSVDATFTAVGMRRAAIERLQTAGAEIRTITSAIVQALESETDIGLVRSGLLLAQSFQDGDAAASRFLASRSPADSNIAQAAMKTVPTAVAELVGRAGENRRLRRFAAALEKPLATYAEGLDGVIAAEAVLGAAAAERARADASQREAVASMLGSVATVRHLLLAASLVTIGVGLGLAVLIGRGISRQIVELTRATQRLAEGDLSLDIPALGRRDELGRMAQALLVFRRNAREARGLHGEAERVRTAKDRRQAAIGPEHPGFRHLDIRGHGQP